MRTKQAAVLFGLVSGVLLACSSSTRDSGFAETSKEDAGSDQGPSLGNDNTAMLAVTLSGKVYAPNGSLALANTLVYVTSAAPAAIPEGAYCDECVALQPGTFAVSGPDGAVEIKTEVGAGDVFVVVQKGQFRRVTKVKVDKAGALTVAKDALTLPSRTDTSKGDTVPKMVILKDDTDYDAIDVSLDKLGLTNVEIRNDRTLLENETELMQYQVVFIPCGQEDAPEVSSETAKANLRKFVEAGGKLYVTDYSYEFVRQPFPGYVSWTDETDAIGSATGPEWDAPAHADDPGLAAWLAASGSASFEVKGNYTTIAAVNTTAGLDHRGDAADVTPKVWITGSKEEDSTDHPTTVSFEHKCGRVLFSTYHTEAGLGGSGAGSPLLAQEKALLYVLLEVGVCVGNQPGVN